MRARAAADPDQLHPIPAARENNAENTEVLLRNFYTFQNTFDLRRW
jgi:hypothetical protein